MKPLKLQSKHIKAFIKQIQDAVDAHYETVERLKKKLNDAGLSASSRDRGVKDVWNRAYYAGMEDNLYATLIASTNDYLREMENFESELKKTIDLNKLEKDIDTIIKVKG